MRSVAGPKEVRYCMTRRQSLVVFLAFATSCAGNVVRGPEPADSAPPAMQREMRGLWVATVANIDWPSRPGLSAKQQQSELIGILSRAAAIGINTIVLQIRPAADALYESSLEPWAAWLTGTQGSNPGYDPLAFAVAESHARGLQLHAWINPLRAGNTADTLKLAPSHVFNLRRDLVRVYGSNIWMDPGDPAAGDRSLRVIADIVTRYDIDGIHADDYFYPYQIQDSSKKVVPFPDDSTYAKYGAGLDRDDWRRGNIDTFIERMYAEVHAIKPGVVVGISPFGIWRPGFPESVRGLDAFATIYADSRKWLQRGWVDYFVPQLYWPISAPQQSFPALLDWWHAENTARRHVWAGMAAYRVQNGSASALSFDEMPAEIRIVRQRSAAPGEIFFSTKSVLARNGGAIAKTLAKDLYREPALVPAFTWLDSVPPSPPSMTVDGKQVHIAPGPTGDERWWLVRTHERAHWTWRGHRSARWTTRLVFATTRAVDIDGATDRVTVQAVDQAGNVSAAADWQTGESALRVMSYNIQAGGASLDSTAQAIRALSPDVITLQKVDVHWGERSHFADQATELEARLGMQVRFAPIYHIEAREYGVALLSRFPIVGFQNDTLTRLSTQDANATPVPAPGLLEAAIDVNGQRVRLFNTHLDYRADPSVRARQVAEMVRYIGASTGPTIVTGDLNATPDALEIQPLLRALRDSWPAANGLGLTYPAELPVKRIDYVLTSPHFAVRAASVGMTRASDHRPVVVDLLLRRDH